MSIFLNNKDLEITVVAVQRDDFGNIENYVDMESVKFFAKSIKYDIDPAGATFKGLNKTDAVQWYSGLIKIDIDGDSYISPFTLPNAITDDKNIKKLYELYYKYFYEGNFYGLGDYVFKLKINNSPMVSDTYIGVITQFSFGEKDDKIGLVIFSINFEGTDISAISKQSGYIGYDNDSNK